MSPHSNPEKKFIFINKGVHIYLDPEIERAPGSKKLENHWSK